MTITAGYISVSRGSLGIPMESEGGIIGPGVIVGTTKIDATPDVPVSREVFLFHHDSKILINKTTSDEVTGAFTFADLPLDQYFFVVSFDHTFTYNAVVADRRLPELP